MAEALKNVYSPQFIRDLATCLQAQDARVDLQAFELAIFHDQWPELELKQRMRHITHVIHDFLPAEYSNALPILLACCPRFGGFESMFFPEYVELYGREEFASSMAALEIMTQFSSAEFAVRPFILDQPKKMMQQMFNWSLSDNHHVRRLSTEGCRPRLPWAMALPEFKRDPSPILPILENLKNDPSEYVRRSVANNLNDISKDHPELVLNTVKPWFNEKRETDRLVKHACRTLLKSGDPDALSLFGYAPPDHIHLSDFNVTEKIKVGESLHFSFRLKSNQPLGLCRLEFRLYFQKSNGLLLPKVFKINEFDEGDSSRFVRKTHSFRPITTRRYYPGKHQLEILVNGVALAKRDFHLSSSGIN
ncbi:MAG: DNA alkylation repair protein [Gammaproteobacteria bacterium]|nr:DNA alkylation repair protein [Gammaproteobacteria bacterium]